MHYEPTYESVKRHPMPEWFRDAKLGVMVSWGLYSVPGWAPPSGPLDGVVATEGWRYWFRNNPYAEWYWNSVRFADGPTRRYHEATYGADFPYEGFVPLFNEAVGRWDPAAWADLFARTGVGYVVLLTKHHDGFLLWPSEVAHPHRSGYQVERDVVGELTDAVRARGMRMGLYYSGGIDWTFNDQLIEDLATIQAAIPEGDDYITVADAHWRELIDRYEPSILWNDIAYPAKADAAAIFADYYNRLPDGVINDRFVTARRAGDDVADAASPEYPAAAHFDFRTPEYRTYDSVMPILWETCRGVGYSFGYNQREGEEESLSVEQLVHLLVDVVSKNGNLLLGLGPDGDGNIPAVQRERLEGLGAWLAVNGEAIYGTRPWTVAEGRTDEGIGVRYTRKGDALFATLLGTPTGETVTIEGLRAAPDATVTRLGDERALAWRQDGDRLVVTLDRALPSAPAHVVRVVPVPE